MKITEVTARTDEAAASAAAPAAQAAGKGVGRYIIPGVGAALGAQDAYSRYKKGDYAGAAISGVGAAASLIPGVGGLVGGLGSAGLNAMRDKARTGSYFPDEEEQAAAVAKDKTAQATPAATTTQAAAPAPKLPPGADPKVFALQQQLIAKGAKITADGKMGPQTQTAMKQFPDVKLAESIKENKMTEAEKIAALRARLTQLESQQQIDEFGGVAAKVGNMINKFKTGISNPRSTNLPSGQNVAQKAGAAVAQNPGKVAAAGATAGALGTAALMPGADKPAAVATPVPDRKPPTVVTPVPDRKPPTLASEKPPAGSSANPPANAGGALSKEEEAELASLAAELEKEMGRIPELDALLLKHQKIRGSIPQP